MLEPNKIINLLDLYKSVGIDFITENFVIMDSFIPKKESQGITLEKKSVGTTLENTKTPNISPPTTPREVIEARKITSSVSSLEELRTALLDFEFCSLKKTAMNTIFGIGSLNSDILLIKSAPSDEEDEQGIPFIGQDSKFLIHALESVGIDSSNIFMTPSVFWRPPGNRDPSSLELQICYPFLEKVISLLTPKIIIFMGSISCYNFFKDFISVNTLRGKWHNLDFNISGKQIRIPSRVIFDSKYLLKNPLQKKYMWQDLLEITKKAKEIKLKY